MKKIGIILATILLVLGAFTSPGIVLSSIKATQTAEKVVSSQADITDKVTIGGIQVYYWGGTWKPLSPGDSIDQGTLIKITLDGIEVSESNMANVQAGDTFTIPLPAGYFAFDDTESAEWLSSEGEKVGTYQIKDGRLIVTINDVGAAKSFLKEGQFNIFGNAKESGKQHINVPGQDWGEIIINEPSDEIYETPGDTDLSKYHYYSTDNGKVQWGLDINRQIQKKVYEQGTLTESDKKHNVLITDDLEQGVTFDKTGGIVFAAYVWIPKEKSTTATGFTSSTSVIRLSMSDGIIPEQRIDQQAGETYSEFKSRVISSKEGSKPTWGVYTDTAGLDHLVAYMGDMPSNDYKVNQDQLKSEVDKLVDSGKITTAQKNYIDKLYGPNGILNGNYIGFTMEFRSDINKAEGSTVRNTANMSYDNNGKQTIDGSDSFEYQDQKGSVKVGEPGSVKIIKTNDDGVLLKGIGFKLQKRDTGTEFVDTKYAGVTDENGGLSFSGLSTGTYKIVETSNDEIFDGKPSYTITNPDGTNTNDATFTVNGDDKKGFVIRAVNHYRTGTLNISGSKVWQDNNNHDGKRPGVITVYLLDTQGQVVQTTTAEAPKYQYTFSALPEYDKGIKIDYSKYTVSDEVNEYISKSSYDTQTKEFVLTNTYAPETTSIQGTKTWVDDEDARGLRPDSITIDLYQNGKMIASKQVTESDDWKYEFADLVKYDANGSEYKYTVKEQSVANYVAIQDGYNFTNTIVEPPTEVPGTPESPEVPATPENPEVPATPESPEVPRTPKAPGTLNKPVVPKIIEKAESPTPKTLVGTTSETFFECVTDSNVDLPKTAAHGKSTLKYAVMLMVVTVILMVICARRFQQKNSDESK